MVHQPTCLLQPVFKGMKVATTLFKHVKEKRLKTITNQENFCITTGKVVNAALDCDLNALSPSEHPLGFPSLLQRWERSLIKIFSKVVGDIEICSVSYKENSLHTGFRIIDINSHCFILVYI